MPVFKFSLYECILHVETSTYLHIVGLLIIMMGPTVSFSSVAALKTLCHNISLVEQVKTNMLEGKVTGVLFFDFTDAFGSVNRFKLLIKLKHHLCISGRLLLYLTSFLPGRQACIKIANDFVGDWIASEHGTSAGTVLGALLFIMYVHDTLQRIQFKFTDDIESTTVADDASSVQFFLQDALDQMAEWAANWDMSLNTSKTKVMLFGGN